MSDSENELSSGVRFGQPIFDKAGNQLGTIRGFDSSGFYVSVDPDTEEEDIYPITESLDVSGMAFIMWRCWECGEMDEIEDSLPDACPNCGAPREELYYWVED